MHTSVVLRTSAVPRHEALPFVHICRQRQGIGLPTRWAGKLLPTVADRAADARAEVPTDQGGPTGVRPAEAVAGRDVVKV